MNKKKVWKFPVIPSGWFEEKEHVREYFEWLKTQLNIKEYSDWYSVLAKDILESGGKSVLKIYGDSHIKAIMDIYPGFHRLKESYN